MKQLFLDVSSSNIGAALFCDNQNKPVWYSNVKLAKSKKDRLCQRLMSLRSAIRWAIQKTTPNRIHIEAPVAAQRSKGSRKSTIAVISAFGVAVEACVSAGIVPRAIQISTWQSILGLKTRSYKAKDLTGILIESIIGKKVQEDAADAIAMGIAYSQDNSISEEI